ncbi:MAG TPA: tRNA (adenosine(37)-N6)-dimethylallyltransferase MiaA [Planctomycetes bacterium]|mgnify:CR=1 FL=1|nr:tRNA (adenosine(37)-N6)-dimethylallyltransferase MiaA [Planctomycetota bacterium]
MNAMTGRCVLLGPTASGKTAIALLLARQVDAEILSLDSMQVYRGMDLGTAKPSPQEREEVPHHLLDMVAPSEQFSVAQWLDAAAKAESSVAARDKIPLFVGGTALYLKAMVSGLHSVPAPHPSLREILESELAENGGRERLRLELKGADPELCEQLHPHDDRRLLRGLEVWRSTGKPLTLWRQDWKATPSLGIPAVALSRPREILHARIEARLDAMLEGGFVEEVAGIAFGAGFSVTARRAIGYAEILEHLDGTCSLEEAREKILISTRTLVRRQETWLRSFPDLIRLEVGGEEDVMSLASEAAAILCPDN